MNYYPDQDSTFFRGTTYYPDGMTSERDDEEDRLRMDL